MKYITRNINLPVPLSIPQQNLPSNLNDDITLNNEVVAPSPSHSLLSYTSCPIELLQLTTPAPEPEHPDSISVDLTPSLPPKDSYSGNWKKWSKR